MYLIYLMYSYYYVLMYMYVILLLLLPYSHDPMCLIQLLPINIVCPHLPMYHLYMYLTPMLLLPCPHDPMCKSPSSYVCVHVLNSTTPIAIRMSPSSHVHVCVHIMLDPTTLIAVSLWSYVYMYLILLPSLPVSHVQLYLNILHTYYSLLLYHHDPIYSLLLCSHDPTCLILLLSIAMFPWSHMLDPTALYCYSTCISPSFHVHVVLHLVHVLLLLCPHDCTNLLLMSSWSHGVHVLDLTTLSPWFTSCILQEYRSVYQPWIASSTSLPVAKWRGCSLWMTWDHVGETLD